MLKLVVFASDSLKTYYEKGEIKERYFNPNNYFDEVHFISLNDEEIEEDKVQKLVGKAKIKIHAIGKWNPWPLPNVSRIAFQRRVLKLIREINPTAIRAYDPLLPGYLAVYCGKKLNVPSVISLHADYDEEREYSKQFGWKKYLKFYFYSKMFEKAALQGADKIMCVTEFLTNYAKKYGVHAGKLEVIYNRVDTNRFRRGDRLNNEPVRIICVGRQNKQKNQQCLIKAIKDLPVELLLIGDGDQHDYLVTLAKELGIENRVIFIKSVPHSEIHKYYADSDIFAIATDHEGMCCHPETSIITTAGLKEINQIKKGDLIIDYFSNLCTVNKVMKRNINEKLIKIIPYGSFPVLLTKEHKVLIAKRKQKKKEDYSFEWIKAEDLVQGDKVFSPNLPVVYNKSYSWDLINFDKNLQRNSKEVWNKMGFSIYNKKMPKKFKRKIILNKDTARMLGYYVAQGSSYKNTINFAAGNKIQELKLTKKVIKTYWGIDSDIYGKKNNYQLRYCGKILDTFFSNICGKGARNKKIPPEIMYSSNDIRDSFLEGFLEGDGCKLAKKHYGLTTVSKTLAKQLILLLNSLGYRNTISIDKRMNAYNITYIKDFKKTHSNKSWRFNNGVLKSIRKIEKISYTGEVYDLHIPKGNNYTTSSFNIHNCIPLVEAMASSLPVVVTDKEPLPEVVQNAGFLVERTPEAFAEAFKKLIEYPELRAELGLHGRLRSMDFDTQIIEEKEAKMYDDLINKISNQITTLLGDTRWLHEERMNYLTNKVKEIKEELKRPIIVLDVGCGDGIVTSYIVTCLEEEDKLYGVDYDPVRLKRLSSKLKIEIIEGDATKLPIQDNFADIINIHHVLEHIPEEEKAISELKRVLKPDGYLIIGVPNEGGVLGKVLRTIHWKQYRKDKNLKSGWHVNFYSRKGLIKKLKRQGLKVIEIKGVGAIFPFYPIHYFILKRRFLFRIGNWKAQIFKGLSDSLFFIIKK